MSPKWICWIKSSVLYIWINVNQRSPDLPKEIKGLRKVGRQSYDWHSLLVKMLFFLSFNVLIFLFLNRSSFKLKFSRLSSSNFHLPTLNSQLSTPNSHLPSPNSQLQSFIFHLPSPNSHLKKTFTYNLHKTKQLQNTLKIAEIKSCLSKKKCYFCTRNNGEVHTITGFESRLKKVRNNQK